MLHGFGRCSASMTRSGAERSMSVAFASQSERQHEGCKVLVTAQQTKKQARVVSDDNKENCFCADLASWLLPQPVGGDELEQGPPAAKHESPALLTLAPWMHRSACSWRCTHKQVSLQHNSFQLVMRLIYQQGSPATPVTCTHLCFLHSQVEAVARPPAQAVVMQ